MQYAFPLFMNRRNEIHCLIIERSVNEIYNKDNWMQS